MTSEHIPARSNLEHPLFRLVQTGGTGRIALVLLLSVLGSASEGLGFVLLVPLLAALGGEALALPFGMELPPVPLPWLLAVFVALVTFRALAEIARRLAVLELEIAVVDGLRMQAVEALLGARWRWLGQLGEGEAEALLISDIGRCGYAVELFGSLVRLGFALAALWLAAIVISPWAALATLAGGALAFALFAPVRRQARRLGEALSAGYEALHARLSETLRALRVVKSFGREQRQAELLEHEFRSLRQTERAYVRSGALAQAVLQVSGALLAALSVWLALERFAIPLASILVLAALFVRALPLLGELQASAHEWAHASPAFERAARLIETAAAHAERRSSIPAPTLSRRLELRDVSVAYTPERPALAGIDLAIDARSLIAICGPSGAGKSTLADLCAGLTTPDAGEMLVDGTPLGEDARPGWRLRTSYVQQEPVLFSGSVRGNLLFARPDAGEAALHSALDEAHAGFVHALPGGIDCDLGNAGRALSGGERQRIALARALLRDPDLVVLDEATSALDPASEEAILAALRRISASRTVIVIAHRGRVLEIADRVVTIEQGRIAG